MKKLSRLAIALAVLNLFSTSIFAKGRVPNSAPVVTLGRDFTIAIHALAQLNGVVTDDGQPAPSNLTVTWVKVSGPGSVIWKNASSAQTSASFAMPGIYELRLTASDGELSGQDSIKVTVSAVNQPPVVNAGPDITINLTDPANLSGTLADDGLPLPSRLSSLWSKVAGPGTVIFSHTSNAITQARFSTRGQYTLRLTANDSELTGNDSVIVTVR